MDAATDVASDVAVDPNAIVATATPHSSNIVQADFDPLTETMTVLFVTGDTYEYYGVSRDIYDQLVTAPSVGKFFMKSVKNQFDFAKRGQVQSI